MLKLLFIEDDQEAIKPVLRLINEKKKDVCCEVSEFKNAEEKIVSFHPDIVVLDLRLEGAFSAETKLEGFNTRNFIWNQRFCPIIIYSGVIEIYENDCDPHPFEKGIKKGANSPQEVLDAICEFLPHVNALKEAESEIRHSFSSAMRDVAPYAFESFADDTQRINETIKRSGRRRLAALMDEFSIDGTVLASWEQYLFPPICDNTQMGDILKDINANDQDPTSFRVVLTPSCDLVASGGRKPKVCNVLVAKCCSIKDAQEIVTMNKKNLRSVLTQGYSGSVIPFPGLKNRIPTMVAKLRDLELIPVEDINTSNGPFLRIASLDSPFRELIAWAYLQTAGRPGLPERDFDSWRDEIMVARED